MYASKLCTAGNPSLTIARKKRERIHYAKKRESEFSTTAPARVKLAKWAKLAKSETYRVANSNGCENKVNKSRKWIVKSVHCLLPSLAKSRTMWGDLALDRRAVLSWRTLGCFLLSRKSTQIKIWSNSDSFLISMLSVVFIGSLTVRFAGRQTRLQK